MVKLLRASRTLFVTLCTTALGLATLTVPNAGGASVAAGEEAPSRLGVMVDGTEINAKDYAGKVLVVTFWASWCAPCKAELPILENLQNAAKQNVKVVAINIEDRDKFRTVAKALSSLSLTVAHDYRKLASEAYGVKGIPHMVIIGRDGKVRNVHRGYSEKMIDQLVTEINAAITAPQPAAAIATN